MLIFSGVVARIKKKVITLKTLLGKLMTSGVCLTKIL